MYDIRYWTCFSRGPYEVRFGPKETFKNHFMPSLVMDPNLDTDLKLAGIQDYIVYNRVKKFFREFQPNYL